VTLSLGTVQSEDFRIKVTGRVRKEFLKAAIILALWPRFNLFSALRRCCTRQSFLCNLERCERSYTV